MPYLRAKAGIAYAGRTIASRIPSASSCVPIVFKVSIPNFFTAVPSLSETLPEGARCFVRYKLVANPVNSSKIDGALWIVLDLLPQFRDAVVYSAVISPLPLWPDGAYQPLARNDDFRPRNQELQHLELSKCQADRSIATTEFHFFEIQGDLAELRNLTNSVHLRICHVQYYDCRGINVVA